MPSASHVELKNLQTRRTELQKELDNEREIQRNSSRKINEMQGKLDAVNSQIKALSETDKPLIISEHAYLRYFERVLGFDLTVVAQQIVPPHIEKQIKALGSGKYPCESYKLCVKQGIVVSVLGKDEK